MTQPELLRALAVPNDTEDKLHFEIMKCSLSMTFCADWHGVKL